MTYQLPFPSDRLFAHAIRILDDAAARYGRPFDWTLGGGTVLALRHAHRISKDIDVFLPDPQYLGYVNPRLSDAAAETNVDYEEGAEFIKIRYPEGEVDFVAGPLLTSPGAEASTLDGQMVRLETDIEIVAKKLYFRGNRFTARDLFDLALILAIEPAMGAELRPWAVHHDEALRSILTGRRDHLRVGFAAIDAAGPRPDFDEAVDRVLAFLGTPPPA